MRAPDATRSGLEVGSGSMLSKKDFEGVVDARLIQSDHQARKIYPNIWLRDSIVACRQGAGDEISQTRQ
jgi:hypothetical protein